MADLHTNDSQLTYYDPRYAKLLPPCLADMGIRVRRTDMHATVDAELGTQTVVYAIEWFDDPGTEQKYTDAINNAQKIVTLATLKSEVSTGSREVQPAPPTSGRPRKSKSKSRRSKKSKRSKKGHSKTCKWSTKSKPIPALHTESSDDLLVSTDTSSTGGCSSHRLSTDYSYFDNLSGDSKVYKRRKMGKVEDVGQVSKKSSRKSRKSKKSKSSRKISRSLFHSTTEDQTQFTTDFSSQKTKSSGSVYTEPIGLLELDPTALKMVVIEEHLFGGTMSPVKEVACRSSALIHELLLPMLGEQFPEQNANVLLRRATIYFAFRDSQDRQKLRRVRQSDVDRLTCAHLPRLNNCICLVLDLVGLVARTKRVPLDFE